MRKESLALPTDQTLMKACDFVEEQKVLVQLATFMICINMKLD